MVDHPNPDYYTYDILSDILSNGRSCRFEQRLINEKHLFTSLDAYITGSIDPGLFQIVGRLAPHVTLEEAEAAVWDELVRMQKEKVSDSELEKVKNKFESQHIFANMNYLNVATNIAYFELIGKAEDINTEVDQYHSVTTEQIRRIANAAFKRDNVSILYYKAQ